MAELNVVDGHIVSIAVGRASDDQRVDMLMQVEAEIADLEARGVQPVPLAVEDISPLRVRPTPTVRIEGDKPVVDEAPQPATMDDGKREAARLAALLQRRKMLQAPPVEGDLVPASVATSPFPPHL